MFWFRIRFSRAGMRRCAQLISESARAVGIIDEKNYCTISVAALASLARERNEDVSMKAIISVNKPTTTKNFCTIENPGSHHQRTRDNISSSAYMPSTPRLTGFRRSNNTSSCATAPRKRERTSGPFSTFVTSPRGHGSNRRGLSSHALARAHQRTPNFNISTRDSGIPVPI